MGENWCLISRKLHKCTKGLLQLMFFLSSGFCNSSVLLFRVKMQIFVIMQVGSRALRGNWDGASPPYAQDAWSIFMQLMSTALPFRRAALMHCKCIYTHLSFIFCADNSTSHLLVLKGDGTLSCVQQRYCSAWLRFCWCFKHQKTSFKWVHIDKF